MDHSDPPPSSSSTADAPEKRRIVIIKRKKPQEEQPESSTSQAPSTPTQDSNQDIPKRKRIKIVNRSKPAVETSEDLPEKHEESSSDISQDGSSQSADSSYTPMPQRSTATNPGSSTITPNVVTRSRQTQLENDNEDDADAPGTKDQTIPSQDSLKGKLLIWWDPTRPNIAHYLYDVEPSDSRTQFIAPPEALGHHITFHHHRDSVQNIKPSHRHTVKWDVDVTLPLPPSRPATLPFPKRRFRYWVSGAGPVSSPPVNPPSDVKVICQAGPCEDKDAPLLPPAADGYEIDYLVNGRGPSKDAPADTRPACVLVWTIPGTAVSR